MTDNVLNDEFDQLRNSPPESGVFDVPLTQEQFERSSVLRFGLRFSSADLEKDFADKLEKTIADCEEKGVIMVPYTGIRDPWEQARLWRQSRTAPVVKQAIKKLKDEDASFLASVLESVGPQGPGPKVTGSLPGFSWHQWGEAVDCYRRVKGGVSWATKDYEEYAKQATKNGLTAGGYWTSLQDWPHAQLRSAAGPLSFYTVKEINDKMYDRFGTSSETSPNIV